MNRLHLILFGVFLFLTPSFAASILTNPVFIYSTLLFIAVFAILAYVSRDRFGETGIFIALGIAGLLVYFLYQQGHLESFAGMTGSGPVVSGSGEAPAGIDQIPFNIRAIIATGLLCYTFYVIYKISKSSSSFERPKALEIVAGIVCSGVAIFIMSPNIDPFHSVSFLIIGCVILFVLFTYSSKIGGVLGLSSSPSSGGRTTRDRSGKGKDKKSKKDKEKEKNETTKSVDEAVKSFDSSLKELKDADRARQAIIKHNEETMKVIDDVIDVLDHEDTPLGGHKVATLSTRIKNFDRIGDIVAWVQKRKKLFYSYCNSVTQAIEFIDLSYVRLQKRPLVLLCAI